MNTRPHHAAQQLVRELGLLSVALIALIAASIAGALRAPALWTLIALLGAGYLLARGASRARWRGARGSALPAPAATLPTAHGSDVMTVSEERLSVDKQTRARERVRLHKYVVTEQVTVTVPVRREHVRLVRELIADGEEGHSLEDMGAPAPSYSITLLEERVVVDKRVVPRERVTIHKDIVTHDERVSETVRHEEIEVELADIRANRDPVATERKGQT